MKYLGLLLILLGIVYPQAMFSETLNTEALSFGKKSSPVTVYIFTDWFCPACRKVESIIEQKAPEMAKHAQLFFIDIPIHEESLNYLPYNISFMAKEKAKYLKLRQRLNALAEKQKAPTDEEVEKLAEAVGTRYQPLDNSEVNAGRHYFEEIARRFGIESTPTILIINSAAKKQKKLSGVKEITQADFPALIQSLKN